MLAVTLCSHLLFDRNSSSPGEFLPSVPPPSAILQRPLLQPPHLPPHTPDGGFRRLFGAFTAPNNVRHIRAHAGRSEVLSAQGCA